VCAGHGEVIGGVSPLRGLTEATARLRAMTRLASEHFGLMEEGIEGKTHCRLLLMINAFEFGDEARSDANSFDAAFRSGPTGCWSFEESRQFDDHYLSIGGSAGKAFGEPVPLPTGEKKKLSGE
jgi:hypothetical protein